MFELRNEEINVKKILAVINGFESRQALNLKNETAYEIWLPHFYDTVPEIWREYKNAYSVFS